MTPAGIELATFRFVAQHLNHCSIAVSYTRGTVSFSRVKRPGRGVDHPPLSSGEFKEIVELYLYPLWAFGACYRVNLTCTFTFFTGIRHGMNPTKLVSIASHVNYQHDDYYSTKCCGLFPLAIKKL